MVEIRTEGPESDPTTAIVSHLHENRKEAALDLANLWYQESQQWLNDAAERRSELGVSHERKGRADNGLYAVHKSAIPPMWDDSEGAWIFGYTHDGAVFQEFGAEPHDVEAKKAEVLAFEWPDAPQEVKEDFADTEGDLVFFDKINHPGLPAIGFIRYGRRQAENFADEVKKS